jgi:predicted DNA-binding protein (UPF0251 family)
MKIKTQAAKSERIALALLEHSTQERAAAALGMSAATIRRWVQKPEFQELYREARREAYSHIIGRAQQAAPLAARTLLHIMVDKHASTAAQSRASRCVLSRANVFRFEDLQAQIESLLQIQREDELEEAEGQNDISHGPHHQTNSPQPRAKDTPRKTIASAAKLDRIILALLEHGSHAKAAAACGMSAVTIWRWLRKPEFQEQYRKAQREAHSLAMTILQQGASAAMSLQKRMMTDKAPAAVRVQAAEFILDLAQTGAQEDLQARVDGLKKPSTELAP